MHKYITLSLKNDIVASMAILLVSIPMAIGIGETANVPLISVILTSVVAAAVVGVFGKSAMCIAGPGASHVLSIVFALSILDGNYSLFTAAVVLAGIIKCIMGVARIGFIVHYIPSSAIIGALFGVSIKMVIKQMPDIIGLSHYIVKWCDDCDLLSNIVNIFLNIEYGSLLIGVVSIIMIMIWPKIRYLNLVPVPLAVSCVAIICDRLLTQSGYETMRVSEYYRIVLPTIDLSTIFISGELSKLLPDFATAIHTRNVYYAAGILAVTTAIDTMVTVRIANQIDRHGYQANSNIELFANGIANIVSGMLGGITIASSAPRCIVALQSNVRTRMTSLLYAVLLALVVIFVPNAIEAIPMPAIMAMLVVAFIRTIDRETLKGLYRHGAQQTLPLAVSCIVTMYFGIVSGIIFGVFAAMFFIIHYSVRSPFGSVAKSSEIEEIIRINLPEYVSFLSKAHLSDVLDSVKEDAKVVIDARLSKHIDYDILLLIQKFRLKRAPILRVDVDMIGFGLKHGIDNIRGGVDKYHKARINFSVQKVLRMLKDGNERFIQERPIHRMLGNCPSVRVDDQHPMVCVISCMDSRLSSERIFDMDLGDMLSIRMAGNIATPYVIESLELACGFPSIKILMVMGHTKCGAIQYSCKSYNDNDVASHIRLKIDRAIAVVNANITDQNDINTPSYMDMVAKHNVQIVKNDIIDGSKIIANRVKEKSILLVGAMYHLHDGKVEFDI